MVVVLMWWFDDKLNPTSRLRCQPYIPFTFILCTTVIQSSSTIFSSSCHHLLWSDVYQPCFPRLRANPSWSTPPCRRMSRDPYEISNVWGGCHGTNVVVECCRDRSINKSNMCWAPDSPQIELNHPSTMTSRRMALRKLASESVHSIEYQWRGKRPTTPASLWPSTKFHHWPTGQNVWDPSAWTSQLWYIIVDKRLVAYCSGRHCTMYCCG